MPLDVGGLPPSRRQHLRVEIHADGQDPAPHELDRHATGAAAGVEHGAGREPLHERDLAVGVLTGRRELLPAGVVVVAPRCVAWRPSASSSGRDGTAGRVFVAVGGRDSERFTRPKPRHLPRLSGSGR